MTRCPRCGKENTAEVLICRWCRTSLAGVGVPSPPKVMQREPPPGELDPMGVEKLRAAVQRLVADRVEAPNRPRAPAPVPAPASARAAAPVRAVVPAYHPPARPTAPDGGRRVDVSADPSSFRLIAQNSDGSDGTIYALTGEQVDIGRTDGDILFDDPYLAARHARITFGAGAWILQDLETRNGIYRRLRAPAELHKGDVILMGRQVLEFEEVTLSENDLRQVVAGGVHLLGTPVRAAWGRLRRIAATGLVQDVFHLCRNQILLGREQGDIVFADDEFLSRRHAQLTRTDDRQTLEDLGAANGTFLRIRHTHTLVTGDQIRMGNVLLRFEID